MYLDNFYEYIYSKNIYFTVMTFNSFRKHLLTVCAQKVHDKYVGPYLDSRLDLLIGCMTIVDANYDASAGTNASSR